MKTRTVTMILCAAVVALCALTGVRAAQQRVNANSNTERGGADVKQVPGKKIGNIKTAGNIIHLELDEGVIQQNLFDLDKRTLRFTPVAPKPRGEGGPVAPKPGTDGGPVAPKPGSEGGFKAESLPLQWDAATGTPLQGNEVRLTKFQFPFSGRNWDAMTVTATGLISFGGGYNDLGLGRFVHLQQVGPGIVNKIPLIAAFLKQRMNGTRHVNELDDRVVITWDTSEPTSGQQDVTFTRTPHNYQAVLYKDGRVDLSYREMTARDGVVGVYTVPAGGAPATTSIDLSNVRATDAGRPVIFEAFHHYSLPGASNMACTAIGARRPLRLHGLVFGLPRRRSGSRHAQRG